MPNVRNVSMSFNGGEISPDMYGRIDDQRYQFGVRSMKNMQVTPPGPVNKRWGLQYIAETKNSSWKTRLISVNSNPSTVVEIGRNYFRFIENGQIVVNAVVASSYKIPAVFYNINPATGIWEGWLSEDGALFGLSSQTPATLTPAVRSYANIQFNSQSLKYYVSTPTQDQMVYGDIVRDGLSQASQSWKVDVSGTYANGSFRVVNQNGNVLTPATGGPQVGQTLYHFLPNYNSLPKREPLQARRTAAPGTPFPGSAFRINPRAGEPYIPSYLQQESCFAHYRYILGDIVYWSNVLNNGVAEGYYQCVVDESYAVATGPDLGSWQLVTGQLDVPNPATTYSDEDIQELTYAQSGDTILVSHKKHPTIALRRGTNGWAASTFSVYANLPSPASVTASASQGPRLKINRIESQNSNPNNIAEFVCESEHGFVSGDYIKFQGLGLPYLDDKIWSIGYPYYYSVSTSDSRRYIGFTIKACGLTGTVANGTPILKGMTQNGSGSTYYPNFGTVELWPDGSESTNTYTVTAISADGVESEACPVPATVTNNIYQRGAFNTVSWASVPGAVKYRIYRQLSGLFGLIGETDGQSPSSFVDENISPDFSINPPKIDTSLQQYQEYPAAVSFYEQRALFAGTKKNPSKIWMTRSFTNNDLGYRIPLQATDRVAFALASKEVQSIRHVVPLQDLLVLTDKSEYRVTSINSDGITPTSIVVRPQSFIGSSYPTPVVLSGSLIYAAARGGRLREAGFDSRAGGYVNGDLSLRASHLFDQYQIKDLAYTRAPYPVVWAVSSSGKLLGATYVPEERVLGWHQHETDGVFESICAAQDAESDYLYAIVRRTINGVSKRYIERIQMAVVNELSSANHLDCFAIGSSENLSQSHTMTISDIASGGFSAKATVQITSSQSTFVEADIGDQLYLTYPGGQTVVLNITAIQSGTIAIGSLVNAAPFNAQNVATSSWSWARDSYSGLSYLQGKTVAVIGDGDYVGDFVVSNGVVKLGKPYRKVVIGLKYDAELETLPIAQQAEGMLQGRMKNVNKVWLRTLGSKSFYVGPRKSGQLAPALVEQTEDGTEHQVSIPGDWSEDGSIRIIQTDPFPFTLIGMTAQVALGG